MTGQKAQADVLVALAAALEYFVEYYFEKDSDLLDSTSSVS